MQTLYRDGTYLTDCAQIVFLNGIQGGLFKTLLKNLNEIEFSQNRRALKKNNYFFKGR